MTTKPASDRKSGTLHEEDVVRGEGNVESLKDQKDVPGLGHIRRVEIGREGEDDDGHLDDEAGTVRDPAEEVDGAAAVALKGRHHHRASIRIPLSAPHHEGF